MIFGVTDNFYAAAALDYGIALGHIVGGVISAFGVNVGADFANQGTHIEFGENYYGIDIG